MTMTYEVQTYTICQGWINCWSVIDAQGNETKQVFDTEAEAKVELEEFLADIAQEIFHGERAPNEGYDPEDFRIVPVEVLESKQEGE
ncbi:MAG TPA: hypothetical protein VKY19_14175 [Ktedonosporobacter sp.]|nr:hypothetical protein [Ktedonosporobacter sp.]